MGRIIDFCLSIRKNFYEQKLSNVGINNGGFIHCEKNVCPLKKKTENKKCWNINSVNIWKPHHLFKLKHAYALLKESFEFNSSLNLADVHAVVGPDLCNDVTRQDGT